MGHLRQHDVTSAPGPRAAPARPVPAGGPAAAAPAERLAQRLARQLGIDPPAVYRNGEARTRNAAHGSRGLWAGGSIWLHPGLAPASGAECERLVAHEMVHAAQARLPAADTQAAEEEAARLAGPLLAGEALWPTVGIGERAAAETETLSGNPSAHTDKAGTVHGSYQMPGIEATLQGSLNGGSMRPRQGLQVVELLCDAYHPWVTGVPTAADLYRSVRMGRLPEQEPPVFYTLGEGRKGPALVDQVLHTVSFPSVAGTMDPGLYIGGRPSPNDVFQWGIGDCYFLALLMSLASRDPARITQIMRPDGRGGATVRLHRRGWQLTNWLQLVPTLVPVDVVVDGTLLMDATSFGTLGKWTPQGAQLMRGALPIQQAWYAEVVGGALSVKRHDLWEVARWAPLLEKAFARFAEVYGQYGGTVGRSSQAKGRGAEKYGGDGFTTISGGWPEYTLPMIYGADVPGWFGSEDLSWVEGGENRIPNAAALDALALLQVLPPGQGAAGPLVTATVSSSTLIPRFWSAFLSACASGEVGRLSRREQQDLIWVALAVASYLQLPHAERQAAEPVIATLSRRVLATSSRSALYAAAPGGALGTVLDLLLDFSNLGTDASNGQRNIYANHAYSVVSAMLRGRDGAMLPLAGLSPPQWHMLYTGLDMDLSSVELRNPHHSNEPAAQAGIPRRLADGLPEGVWNNGSLVLQSDGIFTMTLREFLRNFTGIQYGIYRRS